MKRTIATTKRAMRGSLRCAPVDLEPDSQVGMPELADDHVRRPLVSNLYVSRGSAAM